MGITSFHHLLLALQMFIANKVNFCYFSNFQHLVVKWLGLTSINHTISSCYHHTFIKSDNLFIVAKWRLLPLIDSVY